MLDIDKKLTKSTMKSKMLLQIHDELIFEVPDEELDPLEHLVKEAMENEVKVIFVQPQFSKESAQTIAKAINGVVVPLDPLAKDYLSNLEEMARKVEDALKE